MTVGGPSPGICAAVMAATGRLAHRVHAVPARSQNRTFRIELEGTDETVAVRFPALGAVAVRRESNLTELASRVLPVPEILFVDTDGSIVGRSVIVTRWVSGASLGQALRAHDPVAAGELGEAIGGAVALLAPVRLQRPGFFEGAELVVAPRERALADGILAHVYDRLTSSEGGRALTSRVRDSFWRLVEDNIEAVNAVEEHRSLVHGDLGLSNVLVGLAGAGWEIRAVLDWEYALSGPCLLDVGHLLRGAADLPAAYEEGVARGLQRGGTRLPPDWRKIAWLLDLVSLTGPLVRPGGHPDRVSATRLITSATAPGDAPWSRSQT